MSMDVRIYQISALTQNELEQINEQMIYLKSNEMDFTYETEDWYYKNTYKIGSVKKYMSRVFAKSSRINYDRFLLDNGVTDTSYYAIRYSPDGTRTITTNENSFRLKQEDIEKYTDVVGRNYYVYREKSLGDVDLCYDTNELFRIIEELYPECQDLTYVPIPIKNLDILKIIQKMALVYQTDGYAFSQEDTLNLIYTLVLNKDKEDVFIKFEDQEAKL